MPQASRLWRSCGDLSRNVLQHGICFGTSEMQAEREVRGFAFSGNRLSPETPAPSITDPFGAFFDYAAARWTAHLGGAPADFNLDDVLELGSPTSARHEAWMHQSQVRYPRFSLTEKPSALCLIAGFGNASILEQQLDRLAQNGDVDRRLIVPAAKMAIQYGNPGNLQTLMNHRTTATAIQTAEMLEFLIENWEERFASRSDDLTECTRLIRGLFDTLASSDTMPSPNYLLSTACEYCCMPVVQRLFEQAKADTTFQKKLMQPTGGMGPLGEVAESGHVEILRYLCQQDGIEAHASNRDDRDRNILGTLSYPTIEIIELLLDKFPWMANERGSGDKALIKIIRDLDGIGDHGSEEVKTAKLLLQHVQATPGLIDVDDLLFEATWHVWPDMCQMIILDGHADPQTVIKMSSSGQLELRDHCLDDKPPEWLRKLYAEVLEAIAACLPEDVLQAMKTAAQETESA